MQNLRTRFGLIDRRTCLIAGGAAAVSFATAARFRRCLSVAVQDPLDVNPQLGVNQQFGPSPTFSVIPVVGDGKWIWREPPKDQTGLLEPREFDLTTRISCRGTEDAKQLRATTVVPVDFPEQVILDAKIDTVGCAAEVRRLGDTAAQLYLTASRIAKDQEIKAELHQRLRLFKSYFGYAKEQFPAERSFDRDISEMYLASSPGIEVRGKRLRDLAKSIVAEAAHPWDKALAFFRWTRQYIKPQLGAYTSVDTALRKRVGDCEEYAGVFIALCRIVGIPARLVWVPNHAWAEFYLVDHQGRGHWLPAHTAAYSWFGWTGAHELILQKGDRILIPESSRPTRLVGDWWSWLGAKPKFEMTAELTPVGKTAEEAGPGGRVKTADGKWSLTHKHSADRYMRP